MDRDEDRLVHEPFALAWLDPSGKCRWEASIRDGLARTTLDLEDLGFRWTLNLGPSTAMRYRATFTRRTWDEVGELCVDRGGEWTRVLEMSLERLR